MSWVEDTVTFRGFVRRSGNSLVVTIPSELSQRFLIREGQEFIIFGMSRRSPDFEGALQIYLGYFTVYEKAPVVSLRVNDLDGEKLAEVRDVARRYGATKVVSSADEVKIIFGSIEDNVVKRARSVDEVKHLLEPLVSELKGRGVEVREHSIGEEIFEYHDLDPSVVSKAPARASENIRYKWEI